MEELELCLEMAQEAMDKALAHLKGELSKIRAGKAVPQILDGLKVDYYGSATPINQVASVNTPDSKTIVVKPFEKSLIPEIEKVIMGSDLGLNPQNDGDMIRIFIPPLTEERRITLAKHAKHEAEQGKISLRNTRHDAFHSLKDLKDEGVSEDDIKRGEGKVDEMIKEFGEKIDELLAQKEQDIMTV